LDEVGYLTSDDAAGLKKLPKSLIILGGGAVAVEFAKFFGRFGVAVTLVQRSEHVLSDLDVDAAEVVAEVFRREGIRVLTGTEVVRAEMGEGGKRICFRQDGEERWVEAEEILLAQGRVANTAGLDLEKAWVDVENGRILTNDFLQTSVSHIFAAGDCMSLHKVVYLAVRQGEVTGWNVAKPEEMRKSDERLAMSIVFTEPQVASVGLTEKEAEKQGVEVVVARYAFTDHGKAVLMEVTDGFVKLLADAGTGEILGGACVGPHGGELIHEIVVAMAKRMTVRELAEMPHYHPTLAEIWTYPAEKLVGKK
jgi:pyruvate/2-oxoglutarate dehydrogenase complex dihydrolipoamide dehydrogenase (E3) component